MIHDGRLAANKPFKDTLLAEITECIADNSGPVDLYNNTDYVRGNTVRTLKRLYDLVKQQEIIEGGAHKPISEKVKRKVRGEQAIEAGFCERCSTMLQKRDWVITTR